MKVYEISYFKKKYPIAYKALSKIIPILSLLFIGIILISGYLSIYYPKSIYFYITFFLVIAFYIWWLIRGFEYIFLLTSSYLRYKEYQKLNLENIIYAKPETKKEKLLYKQYKNTDKKVDEIFHWVIIPTFKDPYKMLEDGFESIKKANYDNKKILITLAGEENDKENFQDIKSKVLEKYKGDFLFLNTTLHPANIEGELPGKGSNISYACKKTYKDILNLGINPENILVSVMDSETIVQDRYFNTLSLEYCLTSQDMRDKTIYQPMLFLFNRFFKAPFFSKVIALSTSFYILASTIKGVGTRAQAVQAQSLKSIIETDFYSSETITEDGHQYYRTYCRFNGKFQVKPIYTYVLLEPVIGQNIFESLKLQYNQIKRWAHGMLDFPYIILCAIEKGKKLPFFRTLYEIFWLLEVSVLWSSLQFILLLGTIYFSILGTSYANIIKNITFLSFIILFLLLFINFLFLPWKSLESKTKRIYEGAKYILFSFTIMGPLLLVLGGLAALHSQILILIGKPMGKFNVTQKYRKEKENKYS